MERTALYERIDARVDAMIAAGAAEEARAAARAGASDTARKALGFEELLVGDIEAMKRRTRNYARRQLTWMRKLEGVHEIDVTTTAASDVADEILALWRDRGERGARQPPRAQSAGRSGTNGYMTTAVITGHAPDRDHPPPPRDADEHRDHGQIDPRHDEDHVVEVARSLEDEAHQLERNECRQEPGEAERPGLTDGEPRHPSDGPDRAGAEAHMLTGGAPDAEPRNDQSGNCSSMIGGEIMPRNSAWG